MLARPQDDFGDQGQRSPILGSTKDDPGDPLEEVVLRNRYKPKVKNPLTTCRDSLCSWSCRFGVPVLQAGEGSGALGGLTQPVSH